MTTARIAVPAGVVWTSPTAHRTCDLPAVEAVPDLREWYSRLSLAQTLDLTGRVHTGGVLGEQVDVLQVQDSWSLIALPQQPSSRYPCGYQGWLPSAHLVDDRYEPTMPLYVTHLRQSLLHREYASPIEASIGSQIQLCGQGASLPDGQIVTLPPSTAIDSALLNRPSLSQTALQFLDLPYAWGGLSGHGVDCSGLVHLSFRAAGATVPRDAHDQQTASTPIQPAEVTAGDLVFFTRGGETQAHHVGLMLSPEVMIHAPRTGRRVELRAVADYEHSDDAASYGRFLEADSAAYAT